jgi:5-oxoprolinase (ATP-hydrolysing) subunit A
MARSLSVDLNCDLGESFGRYELGKDAEMMPLITSANIACGFHAGDPSVMARTVSLAKRHKVLVGAHPGYPDLQGFGRRALSLSPLEIAYALCYQIGALAAFTRVAGIELAHVKPHGALYNLASQDPAAARAIAAAVAEYDPGLVLVGLAGSVLVREAEAAGLRVAREGFPDRAYLPDGSLMPRAQPGALIEDPEAVAENAVRLVKQGIVIDQKPVKIDTLCLHGDHRESVKNAKTIRSALEAEGVEIRSLTG